MSNEYELSWLKKYGFSSMEEALLQGRRNLSEYSFSIISLFHRVDELKNSINTLRHIIRSQDFYSLCENESMAFGVSILAINAFNPSVDFPDSKRLASFELAEYLNEKFPSTSILTEPSPSFSELQFNSVRDFFYRIMAKNGLIRVL